MNSIKIIGLGGGSLNQLPYGVYQTLATADQLYLRTAEHPVVEDLKKMGLSLHAYDYIYEDYEEDFEQVYPAIVADLLERAKEENIIYAVPGHPMVGESTSQLLLDQDQVKIDVVGGHSFIDDLFQAVKVDPIDGFQLLDGMMLSADDIHCRQHLIIMQVFHPLLAGDIKIELMKVYPDDHPVYRVDGAGSELEKIERVPLYELDHFEGVHNLMSLYLPPLTLEEDERSFSTTLALVDAIIDSKQGDPWVLDHDHLSLWPYLKEESLELKEAIEADDSDHMIEELGDVFMQVLYHAKLAENHYEFEMEDVLQVLNRKLRRRHPHIFGDQAIHSIEEAEDLWEDIKKKEEGRN